MSEQATVAEKRLRLRLDELSERMREHEGLVRALQAGEVDAVVVLEKHGASISRLQSDEPLYRTIVDALPQSVATVLSDGTIVYVNDHLAAMIGAPAEVLLGDNLARVVAESDRPRFAALLQRAVMKAQEADLTFRWAAGDAPAVVSAMRLPVSGVDAIGIVIVDVRDRVARRAAEESSRAKDDLLAAVSHELRTPLTSIMGWIQLLELELEGQPQVETALRNLRNAVLAETKIVDDLLDLSRSEQGGVSLNVDEKLDLKNVLTVAASFVDLQAKTKSISLTVDIADGLVVRGDPDRLRQVFVNLLSNAVKFTANGEVSLTARDVDGTVVVNVKDSGMGIRSDFLPLLFEPFSRDDPARGYAGLGIGLAISRRLVEAHGGTIEATSDGPQRGSTFTVTLPRA